MIYVDLSITDTDLNPNKKPGVAYRGATPAEVERGFAQPARSVPRDTEIFSAKVSGDHLNDTIDKAILILEGMKNADRIETSDIGPSGEIRTRSLEKRYVRPIADNPQA